MTGALPTGVNDVSASTVRRWVLEVLELLAARVPRLDRALKKRCAADWPLSLNQTVVTT
ncbi:hypothetical protein [Streptomyces sp. KR55]|uniref:hypothetical protein n=1 Tax=Streptomyces sp. KR55 TaxID=3457425 RepID=UPI003FD11B60